MRFLSAIKSFLKERPRLALVLLLVLIPCVAWTVIGPPAGERLFRSAQIKRGDLLVTVSATGTVEPEEVIDVGAQVAGQIISFGRDRDGKTIDYGSVVEEGTVLAKIDDSLYSADVAQADAQLKRAQADLVQLKAKLVQADADWKRASKLGPSEALSQSSYDGYRAAFDVAKANVVVGEAAIVQAQAVFDKAQRNLSYCVIKSPVKGVIIDRRVNIGQTVVSSLNAPSLFLLAKDLTRMQVWIAVNEADIGNIHPGQTVRFTVDAYPGEVFDGKVGKIRLNATMSQNVVTYTVEVMTDNSNGRLLPYLTANAQFEIADKMGALLAPNAALRWSPDPEDVSPRYRPQYQETLSSRFKPAQGGRQRATSLETKKTEKGTLWARDGHFLRPVSVKIGGTDGSVTEISSEEIQEGSEVIIGEEVPTGESKGPKVTNPFAPQLRGGGRR